jgi:hypothetical protein
LAESDEGNKAEDSIVFVVEPWWRSSGTLVLSPTVWSRYGMRFSIQRERSGFGNFAATVGDRAILVKRNLLSIITFSATWRWTWLDGQDMSLRYQFLHRFSYPWQVFAGEEVVCSGVESKFRWSWSCGETELLYKAGYRRLIAWREMFSAKQRNALLLEDGTGLAAWKGTYNKDFDGVMRRSIPDAVAGAIFGIIIATYVPDKD